MKSLQECLQTLVTCAGGDGNLLLNVEPMPNGQIEPRQAARLRELGEWLGQYGQSIYATRGGPFKPGNWGASTFRGNTIYVHVFGAGRHELNLPPVPKRILACRSLTGGVAQATQSSAAVQLTLPATQDTPSAITVLELTLDGPASEMPPVTVPAGQAGARAN